VTFWDEGEDIMAAYKVAAVKITYGCYPSDPHALRFTTGGMGFMPKLTKAGKGLMP
jgi:hypothetical protein